VSSAERSGINRTARICRIGVEPAYRPDWFDPDAGAHVPLPPADVAAGRATLPGRSLVWAETDAGRISLLSREAGEPHIRYDWPSWKRYVLGEQYRTLARPLYTRLPFHYHRVPGPVRRVIAKLVLAQQTPTGQAGRAFPGFPIEQGFELLAHVWARVNPDETPDNAHAPDPPSQSAVVLTHDIDTAEGFPWVQRTAEIELAHGLASVWHVVGRGDPPDYAVLDWLVERGCTIGLHGYNHDNKLAFLPADQIRRRLDACRPLIERYDIQCFRSPSWFRSDTLFDVVKDYVTVDYSRLDTDRSCPGGVGGKRRYRMRDFRQFFQRAGLAYTTGQYFNALAVPACLVLALSDKMGSTSKAADVETDVGDQHDQAAEMAVPSAPLNHALRRYMGLESRLLGAVPIPLGVTLLAVARK